MKVTQTGVSICFIKTVGMLYPKEKRVYEDPYSEKLLPPSYKLLVVLMRFPIVFNFIIRLREKFTPGLIGWLLCRFRYIDDVLKKITTQEFAAVVNLGAGMDCRAYYIPSLKNIKYFEVDRPSVIKKKQKKLKHLLGKLPDSVVFVPINFETHSSSRSNQIFDCVYEVNIKL